MREPAQVMGDIERKVRAMSPRWDRMDEDYQRYILKRWQPDPEESVAPEDSYTTNAPRVLAEKIIAFIAATEVVIRAPSDEAQEAQEEANDAVESLAIGMLNNVNRRLRRSGKPLTTEQMAWFTVVRGGYAAARAVLRKRENGETYEDILPLDPRHLVIEPGEEEPIWAAYRMQHKIEYVKERYPSFDFRDTSILSGDDSVDVWEYYRREKNPRFDPISPDPFLRHPWIYTSGTIIDDQWAIKPHDLYMLNFPVVVSPVTSQPILTPPNGEVSTEEHFGESVFAENRDIWDILNRVSSYVVDLTAKASDPQKDVYSLDGTRTLDEGANDKGAERNLSVANQEKIELAQQADVSRAAQVLLSIVQNDAVAGGLPPQAFGLLDKPLSSVALRQLGNNLEHRVLPRMRAVANCLEGCLENLIAQYETDSFAPITVSGRRFDNQRFANRIIEPANIFGHDPLEVQMELALPEDEVSRWTVAQMAMQPTVTGEPLASLEWTRERVLKMQSAKTISRQNREMAGYTQDPLAMAMMQVEAYIRDGDMANASIWYDKLQGLWLQRQVEVGTNIAQLTALSRQIGLPLNPTPPTTYASTLGGNSTLSAPGVEVTQQSQSLNPANGAVPFAQAAGVGNEPSPEAGFNTTAPRQRDTGLIGPDGQPLLAQE